MNAMSKLVFSAATFALVTSPQGRAQTREAFDVASVKLDKTGGSSGFNLAPGGESFTATNLPLLALIMLAYGVTPRQISGVPSSFSTEAYDIVAKSDRPIKQDQALRMLQTLLADRFKLTLHREAREQPIYALLVGNSGPKFKLSPEDAIGGRERTARGFVYKKTPMSTFALILSQQLGRTVVDKTALKGQYDFTLEYTAEQVGRGAPEGREPTPNPDGLPSIFTAVQEQLGLKLESQKGSLEFIVVDHAETPSEN